MILDNHDTLLQPSEHAGTYQPNFINYGDLFRLLGESNHQSCVLLTSWEKSTECNLSHNWVVKLWNPQTGHCVKTFQGYSNSSWCVRWSKDGTRLLISSTNHIVQLWDSQKGKCLRLFRGHDEEVKCVAWSPNEQLIASCSADATVRVWEVQTGQCLTVLRGHHSWVWSVVWSRDGNYLVSSGNDQRNSGISILDTVY